MTYQAILAFLLFTMLAPAGAEDAPKPPPPELPRSMERITDILHKDIDKAKADYAKAMTSAVEKYQKALEVEMQKATRAGNLDLALIIKGQLEGTAILLEGVPVPPGDEASKPSGPTKEIVTVPASSPMGVTIATLSKGQAASIRYVKGEWSAYPSWKEESPDSPSIDQHRMLLVVKSGSGSTDVELRNTARKPFIYRATEDVELSLVIKDPVVDGNRGSVEYEVQTSN
jgi:hypothetical protein